MLNRQRTLSDIAATLLADCNSDVLEATRQMSEQIMDDPVLYRQLMDPLVREACYTLVTNACRRNRQAIWHQPQPSAEHGREAVAALANATRHSLMDFPLPGGRRLGDAVRQEVEEAAEFYRHQANDMRIKGTWLASIALAMPSAHPDQTVSQALNERKLVSLRRRAERTSQ